MEHVVCCPCLINWLQREIVRNMYIVALGKALCYLVTVLNTAIQCLGIKPKAIIKRLLYQGH